jgi:hypothetical protein
VEEAEGGAGIRGPLISEGGVGKGKAPNLKLGRNIQSRNPPSPRLLVEWNTSELGVVLSCLQSKLSLYAIRYSFILD